jgi:hypothetical protein
LSASCVRRCMRFTPYRCLCAGGDRIIIALGLDALLAPWNFYCGGHFHLLPGWQGSGWIHSKASGGDYFMWIRFTPTIPGQRKAHAQRPRRRRRQ